LCDSENDLFEAMVAYKVVSGILKVKVGVHLNLSEILRGLKKG